MTAATFRSLCDVLSRAIKMIEKGVRTKGRRLEALKHELDQLKRGMNADPARVRRLQEERRQLEGELEADWAQLNELREDFEKHCGARGRRLVVRTDAPGRPDPEVTRGSKASVRY